MIKRHIDVPPEAMEVLETLRKNGFQSYIVGGFVRDSLLNKKPKDIDITSDATPDQVEAIFSHSIPTGKEHGTITVVVNNAPFEITTFQPEGVYSDGRRPDMVVYSTSVEEDVTRRDATINGLLYDGENIIDFVGGMDDLIKGVVRAIGNPLDRIRYPEEDPVRMLRYIRIAAKLGFLIDPATMAAIRTSAQNIVHVSRERIRDEIFKILMVEPQFIHGAFTAILSTGLLPLILPELFPCVGLDQKNPHHHLDVFGHLLDIVKHTPAKLELRVAALLHDVGKPATFFTDNEGVGHFNGHAGTSAEITRSLLRRFNCRNEFTDAVVTLVREHMNIPDSNNKAALRRLLGRVGEEGISDLFSLIHADRYKEGFCIENVINACRDAVAEIIEEGNAFSLRHLAVTGRDLIAAGHKPGPQMGQVLNNLLNAVIEMPHLNQKAALLELSFAT